MLNIAIIGSLNVGKTSLFNLLTNTNFSFINKNLYINKNKYFNFDYNYAFLDKKFLILNKNIILIDCINIENFIFLKNKKIIKNNFLLNLKKKFLNLIKNVNFIFFLVNSNFITDKDKYLSKFLFKYNKKIILLLTKKDLLNKFLINYNDIYSLGINDKYYISIYDKNSINFFIYNLLNKKKIINKNINFYIKNIKFCVNLDKFYSVYKKYFLNKFKLNIKYNNIIKFIILGKNNVGKSSLMNLLCKSNRSFISNNFNNTKNFIMSLYNYNKNIFYLISDSPGLCKKKHFYYDIIYLVKLKFKIILYVININNNICKFDLNILNYFLKKGKYLIVLFNKCDNLNYNYLKKYKNFLIKKYDIMKYMDIYFISCLNNNLEIINNIYKTIYLNYKNIFLNNITNLKINNILKIFNKNKNSNIFNLRYAFICKYYPLIIIIYGNKINLINNSYKKYLLNFYMKKLNFKGFKIFLKFKEIYNPYKKNK